MAMQILLTMLCEMPSEGGGDAMKTRLIYDPSKDLWRHEKIAEGDTIFDYLELTASGVAMRYGREEILKSLQKAIVDLSAVQLPFFFFAYRSLAIDS